MGKSELPPGPPGRFLTGHLHEFRGDRLAFYARCAREYGDVVALRFAWRRVYLVSHPDLVEAVLVTGARAFGKHFALRMNPLVLGNGLLTSEGDFWLRQRRIIQPVFHRQRIAAFAADMVAAAGHLLDGWAPGQDRLIDVEMMRLTLDVTGRTLFGADITGDAAEVGEAARVLQRAFVALFTRLVPWPPWVPTPTTLRLRRAVRRLDAIIYRLIAERRRAGGDRGDLLSLLLHARDEEGGSMTDRQVRDEAMTLFLAAHETTALALSWAWYLLARHPEVEERLAREWAAVLGGRNPTVEDLPRLRLTEQVAHEALRLYPPAPTFGREAREECTVGGYRVRPGHTVLVSPWVMHHDPRWFDRPDEFLPERWAPGAAARVPRYAYLPFGAGPRVCIGNTFALTEMVLVLATLGQRYRFTVVPDHPVALWPTITLHPRDGIRAVLQAR
jgi:cytochrome P450